MLQKINKFIKKKDKVFLIVHTDKRKSYVIKLIT